MLIVDVAFVLAAAVLFENGDVGYTSQAYQTRDECRQSRAEMMEAAKKIVKKNDKLRVYIGECVAHELKETPHE